MFVWQIAEQFFKSFWEEIFRGKFIWWKKEIRVDSNGGSTVTEQQTVKNTATKETESKPSQIGEYSLLYACFFIFLFYM